jgi:hypothetical protein
MGWPSRDASGSQAAESASGIYLCVVRSIYMSIVYSVVRSIGFIVLWTDSVKRASGWACDPRRGAGGGARPVWRVWHMPMCDVRLRDRVASRPAL